MNGEPLPYKDPPRLMEQTLNLAPTIITTFDENVADFKQGRHMQRMAVAREFASGRPLIDFIRAVESSESTIRNLLTEARQLGILDETSTAVEVNDSELSKAIPGRNAAIEFAQLPEEDREAIAAASDVKTKAQRLLEEARRRKYELEQKYKSTDEYKEAHAEDIEKWRAKGRESLIKKGFQDISQSLTLILHELPNSDSKEEARASLKRLANQLADAGIYPDRQPDE